MNHLSVHYLSLIPIYSATPSALQETKAIQLPKANIMNYNNFILHSQCMSLLDAFLQLHACNNFLQKCCTN